MFVTPQDTAVYVGGHFQAQGLMLNWYADVYPSEHIGYAGLDANATVTPDGIVTGVTYGRARVVATRRDLADTGWMSVVPQGTLALSRISNPSSVDVVGVDGSGYVSVVSSGQGGGGAAAWLPGNAGFVYPYATPGGAGATQLFVTNLAGQSTLLAASGSDPRVARDGSWVYFDDGPAIWRVHVDGTGLERATMGTDIYPDPSPDGTRLAFARQRPPGQSGGFQLAVRTLTSGAETLLGPDGLLPRWRPSGDSIAYWSNQFGGPGAIFVIGVDGTGARQVSAPGRSYRSEGLDWSPDGQWLLARADSTLDLIEVAAGLTLPLGYSATYHFASWRW